MDRRVNHYSARSREVVGHWVKRGRPRTTAAPLQPSERQLEIDLCIREACVQTFEDRGTHDWPPTLKVPDAWREPYRRDVSQIKADLPEDVQAAAEAVTEFIAAIDGARADTHQRAL
jgi:hypothetical protein